MAFEESTQQQQQTIAQYKHKTGTDCNEGLVQKTAPITFFNLNRPKTDNEQRATPKQPQPEKESLALLFFAGNFHQQDHFRPAATSLAKKGIVNSVDCLVPIYSSSAKITGGGYQFSYVVNFDGGFLKREEKSDASGRVTGYYTIRSDNGTYRVVEYVADKMGFRANAITNEANGSNMSFPANILNEFNASNFGDLLFPSSGISPHNESNIESAPTTGINLSANRAQINQTSAATLIPEADLMGNTTTAVTTATPSESVNATKSISTESSSKSTSSSSPMITNATNLIESLTTSLANVSSNNETMTTEFGNMRNATFNTAATTSILLSTLLSITNSTESVPLEASTVMASDSSRNSTSNQTQSSADDRVQFNLSSAAATSVSSVELNASLSSPAPKPRPSGAEIPGSYRYQYEVNIKHGKLLREEGSDGSGKIFGSYTFAVKSRNKKLEYVADIDGLRTVNETELN
ncbi:Cuticle protein 10.9-like protein [Dinothrombium tinctorium]|uniref:Cuticle protein 10.9-like protein n=1 Tax=Dinothrombium tinctorium TaxID=1965070 RepID=A0A443RQ84_9ACAR|nr:Cuticle protein 10.9-like protein [Dinothrombium tinctorium]